VRFLADECIPRQIAERLRGEGHDVVRAADVCQGAEDPKVLALAFAEQRLLLTEDRDFGELTVRLKLKTWGVVIVAIGEFPPGLDAAAEHCVSVLRRLGESCVGALTVIEPRRARQRPL